MHVEASVDIPAPPERVWNIAQDPRLRTRWDHRIARYEVHGPPQAGTTVSVAFRMGPLRPRSSGTLLRWAPPFQSVLQAHAVNTRLIPSGAGSWTFEPIDGGTRFTTRFTYDETKLHPLLPKRLYHRIVAWDTRRSLRRLRSLVLRLTADDQGGN